MNRQKHIVVISAELPSKSHETNTARTDRLRGLLSRLHYSNGLFSGYTTAKRFYNDTLEECFIVALKDGKQEQELEKIKQIAFDFDQDAFIHSDSNRHTQLIFSDSTETLGRLVGVSQEEAESFGNYITRDIKHKGTVTNTLHYITKKVQ